MSQLQCAHLHLDIYIYIYYRIFNNTRRLLPNNKILKYFVRIEINPAIFHGFVSISTTRSLVQLFVIIQLLTNFHRGYFDDGEANFTLSRSSLSLIIKNTREDNPIRILGAILRSFREHRELGHSYFIFPSAGQPLSRKPLKSAFTLTF